MNRQPVTTRSRAMREARRHYLAMSAGHADWDFSSSLKIAWNKHRADTRSTDFLMGEIAKTIGKHLAAATVVAALTCGGASAQIADESGWSQPSVNGGEYARLQPEYYAPLDLDERLGGDMTIKEVPGLRWIVDLFDRLGGWCDYVSGPLRRNPRLRLHRAWEGEIPTDDEIEKLADRIGRNPKTEVEIAIVVCIFERLPLPWRTRLAMLIEF